MTVLEVGERVGCSTPAEAFRAHASQIHGYLFRRAGQEAADDLLGEVFAVVVRRWADFDPAIGEVLPWLYGIAHRVLGAEHRASTRRSQLLESLAPQLVSVDAHVWADVDARLDAATARGSLIAALRSLSDDDRDVLLLVAWEGLAPSEAATALGIRPGTARSRLHRARLAVRTALEETS